MRKHLAALRYIGARFVLAAGVGVILFHLVVAIAPLNVDNAVTFISSNASLEDYLQLRQEWRPRILSNGMAHLFNRWTAHFPQGDYSHLQWTIGLYSLTWLLLLAALLWLGIKESALPFLWGVMAALTFGYLPGLVSRVYPWDMPALFFFTLFVVLYHRKAYSWLPAVILTGALFKETTIVLIPALYFLPMPMEKRRRWVLLTGLLFVLLKVSVDWAVGIPLPFLSPSSHGPDGMLRLVRNLRYLWEAPWYTSALWINGGTLLALFLLPGRSRSLRMMQCIAACLAGNLFLFGTIWEFRIWFEAAPPAIYSLLQAWGSLGER